VTLKDAGLADERWKKYFDADEIAAILDNTTTTMIVSGAYPVHVRLWSQPDRAPTVLIASSLLGYGLEQARWQLPFFRAGFNVLQFDFPGIGQSGGPRGGCTVTDWVSAWDDATAFAEARFGRPLYGMGVAEDGLTCYYANANKPAVQAISVHVLYEHGDPDAQSYQGPPLLVRFGALALGFGHRVRPSSTIPLERVMRYSDVFEEPGDADLARALAEDPLSLKHFGLRMAASMVARHPPRVAFEQCRTPVQVIASERNKLFPYRMVKRTYNQLGGPKELVTLSGKGMWGLSREFNDDYCAHVIRWFNANGAATGPDARGRTGAY
jgi:alpha-beta hydrolase superfamily lysophospholipase